MKKWLCLVISLLAALAVLGTLGCVSDQAGQFTQEESRIVAEEYLRSSPTFAFDGIEDSIMLVGTDTMRCPCCWGFEFDFQCATAGYGDRSGQVVAQVITLHTANIVVQEGEVVQATMDGMWDMMQQEILPGESAEIAETITVKVGSSFILSLDSNPTTGYAWSAHFDPEYLELVDTEYEPSSDLIGAGGVESFEFRALQEGDTVITMVYERSWEEGYLQKVVYQVHITEAEA